MQVIQHPDDHCGIGFPVHSTYDGHVHRPSILTLNVIYPTDLIRYNRSDRNRECCLCCSICILLIVVVVVIGMLVFGGFDIK